MGQRVCGHRQSSSVAWRVRKQARVSSLPRLRIGVRVGIHVLLCTAEVVKATGLEVIVEPCPTSGVESSLTTRSDLCSRSWDRAAWTSKWAREQFGKVLARGRARTAKCFRWARHSLASL